MNRDNSTAEQVVRDQSKLYETRADLQRTDKSVCWGRDVAQLVQRRTGTPLRQVRFPGATRDFSPRASFEYRLSYGVRTALVCNRMH